MSFVELSLPLSIKSTKANPIGAFFNPVLSAAKTYDVAVGFFTSSWIRDAAEGIARFASNGGKARWIVSPILSPEDYATLRDAGGAFDKDKVDKVIERSFQELFAGLQQDTRAAIGWLIRDEVLQFRVGVPQNNLKGMLHAKIGVFTDEAGNKIGFSGSYNLTAHAATNWEKIEIYRAWKSEEAMARTKENEDDINDMWEGNDQNLAIYRPTDAALHPFLRETEHSPRPYAVPKQVRSRFAVPSAVSITGTLRPYQTDAINAWFKNNGRGIFSMATGSGKTITALTAAARLANYVDEKEANLLIVVTVPYQHLADQWATEAAAFGFRPVICYGGTSRWIERAQQKLTDLLSGVDRVVMFVAVNDTFAGAAFQGLVSTAGANTFLIADEMHNLGAPDLLRSLPESMRYRLGLSATPVRHGDEEGTKGLEKYFGRVVAEFSLEDAINAGFLCKYHYFPVLSPLSTEEMIEYKELSTKIAQAYASGGNEDDEPSARLQALLIERARLISRVTSKLTQLGELLRDKTDTLYNLVYCGDAKDEGERQVDKTLRMIGHDLHMRANKFTADEDAEKRKTLLASFSKGELQVLVAIKCLDEGVDVPRTETAYILASSTNPRQYIQRRGRVLRKAPGKLTATIYDFIAVPDLDELKRTHPSALEVERRLVRKELDRIGEFADLSINPGHALVTLRELRQRLHLMDH